MSDNSTKRTKVVPLAGFPPPATRLILGRTNRSPQGAATRRYAYCNQVMFNNPKIGTQWMLLTSLLASSIFFSTALTQPAQGKEKPGVAPAPAAASTVPHSAAVPSISTVTSARQAMMLRKLWGVEDIHIRFTASGSLIRFSYRVVDTDKARILNDKKATPYLVDEKTRLALQVPVMEKVGQLRQVATPQNGREYWMAFSNKGHYVSPGNHVDVVIGKLRIEGLVVEGIQRFNAPSR